MSLRGAPIMFRVGSFFRFFFALAFLTILVWSAKSSAVAQQDKSAADQGTSDKSQETDPLKRPINEKQKKQNAKSLKIELSKQDKKWLDEDVRWIISDEERATFKQLSNEEERGMPAPVVQFPVTAGAVALAVNAPGIGSGVRLIALTGYGSETDRQRSAQAGFDAHLTKPVDLDRLLALITEAAT